MRKVYPLLLALFCATTVFSQTTYYSKSSATDFTSPASWGTNADGSGSSPAAITNADNFVIANAAVMNLNAGNASVRQLNINSGSLTVASNALTVDIAGAYNSTLNATGGTLTVTGGSIIVNGNFVIGTGGKFNQSGGTISVDGNNGGNATGSIASGTFIVNFSPTANGDINLTGGTFVIVDPHYTTTNTFQATIPSAGATAATGTHTFKFGDGISTDNGSTSGCNFYSWNGTGIFKFRNLTLETVVGGTNRFFQVNGSFQNCVITGDLTINAGAEFRNSGTTAANGATFIGGNLINNGTFTSLGTVQFADAVSATSTSLTLNPATAAQTISGTGVFRNLTASPTANFTSILINNTHASGVTFSNANSLLSGSNTGTLSGTLTFTTGVVHTGSNAMVLGISTGTLGTLTFTAGGFGAGSTFSRWFATATAGTTITAGAVPAAGTGSYPFLIGTNSRNFHINRPATTGATGGIISVKHDGAAGLNSISAVTDGAYSIDRQTSASWEVSTSGGFAAGTGTFTYAVSGQGLYTAVTSNSRVMKASAVVGTHQTGTSLPSAQRTAIVAADFTGTFYLGLSSVEVPIASTQTGKWEDPATWVGGIVPVCANYASVASGHTVTIDGVTGTANSNGVIISTGGTLVVNGGILNVGCTNNNSALTNNGTLTVSSGTINVNGNLAIANGSTFTHSGGNIVIDGNNNSGTTGNANSVASGTPLFGIGFGTAFSTGTVTLSGGTITIVDPHVGSATNTSAYSVYANMASGVFANATTSHTFQFGDGVSTAAGSSTSGFYVSTFAGSGRLNFGNLTVNSAVGTNRNIVQTGTTVVNGNLTVTLGTYDQGTGTTNVGGNISVASGGTLLAGGSVIFNTVTGTTAAAQTAAQSVSVSGTGVINNLASATGNFTNITVNNTSATGVTINALNNIASAPANAAIVSGNITFTAGTITAPGANGLLWGTVSGGASGTLTVTSGGMAAGSTFGRFFTAAQTGSTITAATVPTTTTSRFPFVDASGNNRSMWVTRVGASAAGVVTVKYTDGTGTSPVSIADATPAYTVDQQFNGKWTVGTAGTTPSATSFTLAVSAPNAFGGTLGANYPRITTQANTVGTNQAGTTLPHGQRTGVTLAQLTAQDFYIGVNAADVPFISVASGAWENAATWNKSPLVPAITDAVIISSGHTVTVNTAAANASTVIVNAGGTLDVTGNTLTVNTTLTNSGTVNINGGIATITTSLTNNSSSNIAVSAGSLNVTTTFTNTGTFTSSGGTTNVTAASTTGITNSATTGIFNISGGVVNVGITDNTFCNRTFTNNGTLTVSATGVLNVYGNIVFATTATFNQSGGDINVDGNAAGVSANSVATGTNIFRINTSTVNLTGGNITIIDPHTGTSTSDYSFGYNVATMANAATAHNLRFGNGVSTDATTNTAGFMLDPYVSSARLNLGNFIINTTTTTGNRFVALPEGLGIAGNLTIQSGSELRATGSFLFAIGGDVVNNGTFISTIVNLGIGKPSTTTVALDPSTVAQSISGSGVFQNATSSPTASLANLIINNTNATGVTLNVPLSISGTLTLTAGIVNTTSANLLSLGTSSAAGTLVGGSATAYIKGPFARTFAASRTATGTFSASTLFPVGSATSYLPIDVDPSTSAGGAVIFKSEAFNGNLGTLGAGVTSLSTNRWEALPVTGAANLTNTYIRLSDASIVGTNKILQSTSAAGVYTGIPAASAFTTGVLSTSNAIAAVSYTGYLAYGNLTSCTTPADQPTGFTVSEKNNTSFTASFTPAASAPSHYLVVRYAADATPTAPTDFNTYAVGATLGSGGNTGTVVANVASPASVFTATGLTANTIYDIYIYSYNNSGCSGPAYNVTTPLKEEDVTTCAAAVTAPSALSFTALSSTGFTVNWTDPGTANLQLDIATDAGFTSFVAGYQAKALTPGTTNEVVTLLSASTQYHVRIRAIDAGCYSSYASASVTTLCAAVNVPYSQNFDAVTAPAIPSCILVNDVNADGFTWATTSSNPSSAPNAMRISYNSVSTTTAMNDWFFLRGLNLTGGTSYRISFKYRVESATFAERLKVSYGTNPGPAAMTTLIADLGSVTNTTYQTSTTIFSPGSTDAYYIGFHGYSLADKWLLYVDDILIEEVLAPQITNFTSSVNCGVSTLLTINGTDLTGATVTIGGSPVTLATNTATQITANISADMSGTIEVTTAGGTANSATSFSFTVAPVFTLSNSAINVCSGSSSAAVTITAGDADYNTYLWSPNTNVSGSAAAGWTFNPTVSGTYTLTASQSAGLGCSRTATVAVTVKPAVSFSSVTATPATICANSTSQLAATASVASVAMITEVTQYRTGTGATTSYPSYITGEDLVEISNVGSSSLDVSGMTLEVWTGTSVNRSITLPASTSIPVNGVLVVHIGSGTDDAANRYFNAGGATDGIFSDGAVGYVLKSGSVVLDAVATNSYSWPVASGVTAADWSGNLASSSGLAGATRTAASDNNTAANWTLSSAGTPQSVGTFNAGLTASSISYEWTPATFLDDANIANPVASSLPGTMGFSVKATDISTGCFAISSVTVTVNPLSVGGTASANQSICSGATPANITLAGNTGSVVKWQRSTASDFSAGVTDIAVTSTTLDGATDIGAITVGANTTFYFRAVVKSGVCADAFSLPASVTVSSSTIPGSITQGAQTICIGNLPAQDLILSGNTGSVVKWQKASDNLFTTPIDIASTSATLTGAVIGAINENTYFRAVVQNGACASANTSEVLVGVNTTVNNSTSLAGTVGGAAVCANYDLATSNDYLNDCNLIASVVPSGASPVSGNVNTCVKIDATVQTAPTGEPYVQRHFDILPASAATTATSTITLYFNQSDFTAFNFAKGTYPSLPVDGADAAGYKANLRVTQYNGTGTAPGNYTGTAVQIVPTSVTYNAAAARWSVTFSATGSGGFYVHTGQYVLPVALVDFKGEQTGQINKLFWKTLTEKNNKGFELERSADGKNFSKLVFVATKADNGNSTSAINYSFDDMKPLSGSNYYRLKQIDQDGKISYSNVILLSRKVADITLTSVYPNPASRILNLAITSPRAEKVTLVVTDLSGKMLVQQPTQLAIGENLQKLDVLHLAAGTYFIKVICANGCESAIHKFIKY